MLNKNAILTPNSQFCREILLSEYTHFFRRFIWTEKLNSADVILFWMYGFCLRVLSIFPDSSTKLKWGPFLRSYRYFSGFPENFSELWVFFRFWRILPNSIFPEFWSIFFKVSQDFPLSSMETYCKEWSMPWRSKQWMLKCWNDENAKNGNEVKSLCRLPAFNLRLVTGL